VLLEKLLDKTARCRQPSFGGNFGGRYRFFSGKAVRRNFESGSWESFFG